MTGAIKVFVDNHGQSRFVGWCHYITKQRSQSSVFEYDDAWRRHAYLSHPIPAESPARNWPNHPL